MKKTYRILLSIILISSLGQVMSDLYLPSMPAMMQTFGTTTHAVQLSLSLFMFGLALSQLFYGVLSDVVGRQKPLLIGMSLCLLSSLLCLFSINIQMFILSRFLQGFGAGAGVGLSRSIMRDVFSDPKEYAQMGSYLTIAMILLIMLAPLLGGYIQHYFGWRASFLFLSIYTLSALFIIKLSLPETSQHHHLDNVKTRSIINNIRQIVTNSFFIGYSACIFLAYGGILAWLTIGPILLVKQMGLSPVVFGWVCVIMGLFFIMGSLLNAKLVKQKDINFMLKVGVVLMLVSGLIMMLLYLIGLLNIVFIFLLVGFYFTSASFIFPNAGAGALSSFKKIAGTASALLGAIQIIGGAIASTILALIPILSILVLSSTFILCGLGCHFFLNLTQKKKYPCCHEELLG